MTPLVRALLRYVSWLVFPAAGVAAVYVLLGFAFYQAGNLHESRWEDAAVAVRVVAFVLGTIATPVLLPVMVAHGVTRARFTAAAGVIGVLVATAAGLYMTAGFLVERAVYAALDVPQALQVPHLFDSAGDLHLVFAEHALLAMAYQLGGFLIGTGYYGYGGWLGTGLLLPGVLAAAAVEYIMDAGWVAALLPRLDLDPPDLPAVAAIVLSMALIALGLAASRALIRPVAIHTRRLP